MKFIEQMMEFLPGTISAYNKHIEEYGEVLETIVIEDIFMPEVIKILNKEKDVDLLKRIFEYFEEVSNTNESQLLNVFLVTVLEVLGNDKGILEKAKKYMGPNTTKMQIEADKSLGRK